jgi:hypothetical protein
MHCGKHCIFFSLTNWGLGQKRIKFKGTLRNQNVTRVETESGDCSSKESPAGLCRGGEEEIRRTRGKQESQAQASRGVFLAGCAVLCGKVQG